MVELTLTLNLRIVIAKQLKNNRVNRRQMQGLGPIRRLVAKDSGTTQKTKRDTMKRLDRARRQTKMQRRHKRTTSGSVNELWMMPIRLERELRQEQ